MASFVALYRGATIAEAQLVAVSADPALVTDTATRMLQGTAPTADDPVLGHVRRGRDLALRAVVDEARHANPGRAREPERDPTHPYHPR